MYINNPTLPYCCPVGTRLAPGSLIRISGTVSPYATCFAINLQCGANVNPRDDVALHLSPVFTPPPRIVRNSISGNRWGPEESFGGFPLAAGSPFEFLILVEAGEFRIALNGMHFTEFRHRIPFERITHIAIDGDAQINTLVVEGSPYAAASAPPMEMPFSSAPPYGSTNAPPYPAGGPGGMPGMYPPLGGAPIGSAPYPSGPTQPGIHPYIAPSMPSAGGMPYPPAGGYPSGPPGAYPGAPGGPYPGAGYPSAGAYPPGQGMPQQGYPASSSSKPGIGGMIGTALGGLTAGAAATSIGSALFGNKNKGQHSQYPGMHPGQSHKPSKPIPIGAIAAGVGATALGAAVLTGHHPFKKVKKVFKHKHKFGKFKHKGWNHKGWGSSSSSSSEEEE